MDVSIRQHYQPDLVNQRRYAILAFLHESNFPFSRRGRRNGMWSSNSRSAILLLPHSPLSRPFYLSVLRFSPPKSIAEILLSRESSFGLFNACFSKSPSGNDVFKSTLINEMNCSGMVWISRSHCSRNNWFTWFWKSWFSSCWLRFFRRKRSSYSFFPCRSMYPTNDQRSNTSIFAFGPPKSRAM